MCQTNGSKEDRKRKLGECKVYASDFSVEQLKQMKQEHTISNKSKGRKRSDTVWKQLDFSACPLETINQVIPKRGGKRTKFGQLDPPDQFRVSTDSLLQWRSKGQAEQQQIIDDCSSTMRKAAAATRKPLGDCSNLPPRAPKPAPNKPPSLPTAAPDVLETELADLLAAKPQPCHGLTLKALKYDKRTGKDLDDADVISSGFNHLRGEAIHNYGTAVSQGGGWELDAGFHLDQMFYQQGGLRNENTQELFCILKCSTEGNTSWHGFVSPQCSGSAPPGTSCCLKCEELRDGLKRKCRSTVARREKSDVIDGKRIDLLKSPTEKDSRIRAAQQRHIKKKAKLKSLQEKVKSTYENLPEIGLSRQICDALGIDDINDLFLKNKGIKETQEMEKHFPDATTTQKELSRYLAKEALLQSQQAKEHGRKTCPYSPIMLRFAIELYIKLGHGRYDFLADVFNLPLGRTVQRYCSGGASTKDGIQWDNLNWICNELSEVEENAGEAMPMNDPRRLFYVAFDSTKIADGITSNPHTNEITGIAYDTATSFDAFKAVVETMETAVEVDDQGESDAAVNSAVAALKGNPDKAKHYLVFIAQRAAAGNNHKPLKTTVARYGVQSIDSDFLLEELEQITHAMHSQGAVLVALGCDGAAENRSAIRSLANLSVRDLIGLNVFPSCWLDLPNMPLDFKVAYWHPCFEEEDRVFIWIHSDMPHAIKKVVNALECSSQADSRRDLKFRGHPLSLEMCHTIWKRSCGAPGSLATTKLNQESFVKNPASRMNCFLAFRVTSQTMVDLIDRFTRDEEKAMHEPLTEVLFSLNRVIDIINAQARKKMELLGGEATPTYIEDLTRTVQLFTDWQDTACSPNNFIPATTNDDLRYVCFSTMGLALNHLGPMGTHASLRLKQSLLGSDVCEHPTAKARNAHSKESFDWAMNRADVSDSS